MNKSLTTLVLFLLVKTLFAQELYVSVGKNYTSYSNSNSNNDLLQSSNKLSDPGNSYELGVVFNKKKPKIAYSVGVTVNEFNASYALNASPVRFAWHTQYIGIQNSFLFELSKRENLNEIKNSKSSDNSTLVNKFKVFAKLGLNTALLINGNLDASGVHYLLKNNPDYNDLIFQPFTGLQVMYPISQNCKFNAGYQISVATIGKEVGNTFNYINHSVQVGINLSLN